MVTLPVLIFMFKETKGKTLEEIDDMFSQYSVNDSSGLPEKDMGIVDEHSEQVTEKNRS